MVSPGPSHPREKPALCCTVLLTDHPRDARPSPPRCRCRHCSAEAGTGTRRGQWNQLLGAVTPRACWRARPGAVRPSVQSAVKRQLPRERSRYFFPVFIYLQLCCCESLHCHLLNCTDTVKLSARWEFSLKMLNQGHGCVYRSLSAGWWHFHSHPSILLQPHFTPAATVPKPEQSWSFRAVLHPRCLC